MRVLEKTKWRVKGRYGAMQLLGMKSSTSYTTMRQLGIPTQRKKDRALAVDC